MARWSMLKFSSFSVAVALVVAFQPGFATEDDKVSLHDLNAMEWAPLATGVRVKPVLGATASFLMVDLEAGAGTNLHHHTYEAFHYGIEGDVSITMAGVAHSLNPDRATVCLPDVEHVWRNNGTTRAVAFEVQPIRRTDMVPPRARLTFPSAPQAMPVPEGRTIAADFRDGSATWTRSGGNREASLSGDHVALRVLIVAPGTSNAINLRPSSTGSEQLSYLLRGAGELTANGTTTAIKEGTLVIMPPASSRVLFRTMSTTPARIVEFHLVPGAQLPSIK